MQLALKATNGFGEMVQTSGCYAVCGHSGTNHECKACIQLAINE